MASIVNIAAKLIPLIRNKTIKNYDFISDVETYFTEHQSRIVENWYYYLGYHNLFFTRFEGEDENDFIRRVENATIENHIQPTIDIIAMYLYGNEVIRVVKRNDSVDEKLMNILKTKVWNRNNDLYDDIKAVNTLVSGYTVIQRVFLDMRTDKPFSPASSVIEKAKYGYIKKIPFDSVCAIPMPYIDSEGRVHYDKFGGVLLYIKYDNLIGNNEIMELLGTEYQDKSIIEYITDDYWIRFTKSGDKDWAKEYIIENPYKRVDIPFSFYKNNGDPLNVEGESDVNKMKKLNRDLNELADGDRSVIRSHQYPILLGKHGAKLPVNFIRTKDAVIDGIEGDGTFEYLTWTGNLEESRIKQDTIRDVIGYVAGISAITRGVTTKLGQIRSGSPLKALLSIDAITTNRKIKYFKTFERQEMYADIKFYEYNTGINLDIDNTITFDVVYDTDITGINELINEEIKSIKVQSGVADIESVLRDEHPDWTDEQIKKAVEQLNEKKISVNVKQVVRSPEKDAIGQM